jgi:hypothetical protein
MFIGKYDFECIWDQDSVLPSFPGSMLRGALGHALKKIVCTIKKQSCENCLLNKQCLYSKIFENKKSNNPSINLASIPHPYMIEWEPEISKKYNAGESFIFSLILFGEYIEMLPYFVYAIDHMGQGGIGGKNEQGQRATMYLDKVYYHKNVIYNKEDRTLPDSTPFQSILIDENHLKSELAINQIKINLITPLRLKEKGKFTRDIDFPIFIRAIIRRLESIWNCYSDCSLDIDKDQIMPLARTIKTINKELLWQTQKRYSNRQSTAMNMDGIVGKITFEGNLKRFVPFIKASEFLHIGKATSFGLGKYVMIEK